MKLFLQVLLTLGLLSLLAGTLLAFTGRTYILAPQGYWRGAIAFWMLIVAVRMVYPEKK
jgi:hypothetical protein